MHAFVCSPTVQVEAGGQVSGVLSDGSPRYHYVLRPGFLAWLVDQYASGILPSLSTQNGGNRHVLLHLAFNVDVGDP